MSFHLRDHIYIAQFRDELILLDLKQDTYTICFQSFSDLLIDLLDETKSKSENKPATKKISPIEVNCLSYSLQLKSDDLAFVKQLIDDNIIEEQNSPFLFHIDRKPDTYGVSNVDWRLPLDNKKVPLNGEVLKAFVTLLKINFYMKVRGFYATIQLIKNHRKERVDYIIPSGKDLRELANIVNKACLLYPTRTKCLEWAMTYVLTALKQGWKCNLEIGVQNYPFMAHAWVECDGKVVMDSQDLREGLAIILNEPFRKVKI